MTAARRIPVRHAGGVYDVVIEPGLLARAGAMVAEVAPAATALLAVDDRVADSHGAVVVRSLDEAGYRTIRARMVAAESRKTLATVQALYGAMLAGDPPLDRDSPVVAMGGGIVGDTAGFAAATFLRGLPLVHVPTTLLAMVDASIGGKTGVNLDLPGGGLGKNLVGAFWPPRVVLADPRVLETLDERDLRCGLAECVKHALVADAALLDEIEASAGAIGRLDADALVGLIDRCARIKVSIVEADEREAGSRALLNLGHTFAHAIEAQPGLDVRHGEAVSIGLAAAAYCAVETGRLDAAGRDRVTAVLEALGLPVSLPATLAVDDLVRAMRYDKKSAAGRVRLVLPRGLGAAEIVADAPPRLVEDAWRHVGAAVAGGA